MKIEYDNQYLINSLCFFLLLIFMEFTAYIAFSILVIYALIILFFSYGWEKLKPYIQSDLYKVVPVSIIVACRNEEKNILRNLECLAYQSYPKEKTEIIIVNDHSTDNTRNIILRFIKDFPHIKLLDLPDTMKGKTCLPCLAGRQATGKKEALAFGIKNSKSDIIVTTDADCIMMSDWLNSMMQYYVEHKPKILAGPVSFNYSRNIFHKLQALEFLSLLGSGAGATGINKPIMCNGANLLFEKLLYENSNTQNKLASGDDIFLMLYAKSIDKKSIHFIKSTAAIVYTKPAKTIRDFFHQRVRWTSKSKAYRDFDIIFTAIFVALANLVLATSFTCSFWDYSFFKIFTLFFVLKSIVDLVLLIPVSKFFSQTGNLWLFIPLQIIYPFYIVFTVIFGFLGNFTWKGRYFREKR